MLPGVLGVPRWIGLAWLSVAGAAVMVLGVAVIVADLAVGVVVGAGSIAAG